MFFFQNKVETFKDKSNKFEISFYRIKDIFYLTPNKIEKLFFL